MMPEPPPYLEVAVAAPIVETLTYASPKKGNHALRPGIRLLVPLGGRIVTGYLLSTLDSVAPGLKIRPITEPLDETPLFPESMIPFFRWIARYYQYPIGEVIKGALPAGLTSQSGRRILLTDTGAIKLAEEMNGKPDDIPWLAVLLARKKLTPATVRKIWRTGDRRLLEQWARKEWVHIEELITGQSVRTKTETCIQLAKDPTDQDNLKPSEEKTLDLVRKMLSPGLPLPRSEVAHQYSGAGKAIKSLAAKGLLELTEQPVYRDPFGEPPQFFPKPQNLTAEQETTLKSLRAAIRQQAFAPFLLHGVTGSGKTEVYLRATEETLSRSRGVLVLVPEIALATQLEGHFISRFGDQVALLHSGLSAGERFDQWIRVASGKAKIVIGARSAIFAPLADPGLIIVDEEHDGAYKQEEGLRYQARDLAVLRGSQTQAVVILGSATPSIITYSHAQNGKYGLLRLDHRVENRPLPEVHVVNLREINTVSGRPPLFSPQLRQALGDNLAAGDQSLIFLNRRGFASCMICQDCGQPIQCSHCNIALTLHKARHELICHYCGYSTRSDIACPKCRSIRVNGIGFGTERLEAELAALYPEARIARLDRDTTMNRTDYLKILKAMHRREIDILIGTQMITKGHHFPHVTLVGVVWADTGLGIPDYKAGERTFQLLAQVTGRAGRGGKAGRVILQTSQPEHYTISTARCHDYQSLFTRELGLRKELGYPPFSRLINLQLEGTEENDVQTAARALDEAAQDIIRRNRSRLAILGPAPSPLSRLRGKYRWQILLKGRDTEKLHELSKKLIRNQRDIFQNRRIKLTVDVDPENML